MQINILYAMRRNETTPLGSVHTKEPYNREVAINLRMRLISKYPKSDFFKRVEQQHVPGVPFGMIHTGNKGARFVMRINSSTGKTYRRYLEKQ